MQKSVAHIFGGEGKVKIMRLFIFNPNLAFTSSEVAQRAKTRPPVARRELADLIRAGLVRKRGKTFTLNKNYRYLPAIGNFLIDAAPLSEKEIVKRLSASGNIKLVLISGVFLHDPDSRVDLLVVGDNIRQGKLLSIMSSIEAELGSELRYAVFETSDFNYRLGIYDKLIRDILESRHEKILNKLSLQPAPAVAPGYPQA
ncbi:MAG: hypothetical protein HYT69_02390 [Candidatus Zambryskibacteria bacterium]|nr:hypothetical protein [Candidatus Zambryskibacteria bacterium]